MLVYRFPGFKFVFVVCKLFDLVAYYDITSSGIGELTKKIVSSFRALAHDINVYSRVYNKYHWNVSSLVFVSCNKYGSRSLFDLFVLSKSHVVN